MARFGNGIFAGLVATIVLSAFMVMKQMMGMMPELDVINMLTTMSGASSPVVGWLMHFMIGSIVWGGLFALTQGHIPDGNIILRDAIFGAGAWLLMMVMVMPLAGAGLFGLHFGMAAPVMTFLLHEVFGCTLGAVYGLRMQPKAA
ncbi:MAG: hypothetical protein KGJ49_04550 [Alphaproteobacteria bacterium]|nr:hypothetical protein [Alphaproteobacteria bacterium]